MKPGIELELSQALFAMRKEEIIEYTMQVRFERNFLQGQLNKLNEEDVSAPDIAIMAISQKLQAEEMGDILSDFIRFVNETKGYKVGVGKHLIEKYINKVKK